MNTINHIITNYFIVQWATILSPIIAVLLAWWTSRSGARDTAKLIKCAKGLMEINLQIKLLELSKEAKEEHAQFDSLLEKSKNLEKVINSNYSDLSSEAIRQYEEKESSLYDKSNQTFDKRIVIAETMSKMMRLLENIKKL